MNVAYYKCLCVSRDKAMAKQLREQGIEVRVTKNNPLWINEAKLHGAKLPFIIRDGKIEQL